MGGGSTTRRSEGLLRDGGEGNPGFIVPGGCVMLLERRELYQSPMHFNTTANSCTGMCPFLNTSRYREKIIKDPKKYKEEKKERQGFVNKLH